MRARRRSSRSTETPITTRSASAAPTPFLVWGRAGLLGGAMLVAGTVSHVAAGGLVPHPAVVLLLGLGLAALAARFLLGPASTRRIVTLVVVGQGAAHTALSALAGHRGDAGTPAPGPHSHPATLPDPMTSLPVDADGRRVGSLLDAYQSSAAMAPHDGPGVPLGGLTHLLHHLTEQGPLMLAAHVAGAVVLGLVLAVGERALWALIHLAAARVVVLAAAGRSAAAAVAALRAAAETPRPRPRATGFIPVPRLDRPALSRRGPPALLAV